MKAKEAASTVPHLVLFCVACCVVGCDLCLQYMKYNSLVIRNKRCGSCGKNRG